MSRCIALFFLIAAGVAAIALSLLGRGAAVGSPGQDLAPASRGATPSGATPSGDTAGGDHAARTAPQAGAQPGTEAGAREATVPGGRDAATSRPAQGAAAALTEEETAAQEPIVTEQLARNAMRLVGKDRAAEAIWLRAINDPGLSRNARSDLIEDIADEGFPSPATKAELPLIEARLALIERHSPYAMDDVNAAAFREAYKDLLNTMMRLRGAASR